MRYAIDGEVELIAGSLLRCQSRLVEAWTELYIDELRVDRGLQRDGNPSQFHRTSLWRQETMKCQIYRVVDFEITGPQAQI